MYSIFSSANRSAINFYLSTFAVSVLMLLITVNARAQYNSSHGVTDTHTPPGIEGGSPAGSYALSGFDTVNLYNGNLNFALPLLNIGGRGEAGFQMTLQVERRWIVKTSKNYSGPGNNVTPYVMDTPSSNPWEGLKPGYGPGVLQGRRGRSKDPDPGICIGCSSNSCDTLTRLTFTAGDGTEYEMRDVNTDGKPHQSVAWETYSRGNVFVTKDGTSATFVADSAVTDVACADTGYLAMNGPNLIYPSGHLKLRNGIQYRIDGGTVTWMRDRNGNQLSFVYGATNGRVTQITDSLGRVVTVSYSANSGGMPGQADTITFKGFGGVDRTLRVWYSNLEQALRPGYTAKSEMQLFALNGSNPNGTFNPVVISSVEIPDGRRYYLKYNEYGELARVDLPTGGAYEYDYNTGTQQNSSGLMGGNGNYRVYRRVTERREYPDGTALASKAVYTPYAVPNSLNSRVAEIKYDGAGTRLTHVDHYFYNNPGDGLFSTADYPVWTEGREYRTDTFDISDSLIRRQDFTWEQRAPVSWMLSGPIPVNDPRLTQTLITLSDANLVSKQTVSYDQFNNQTDVYEYDYGSGDAGPLIRHTHTDYVSTASYIDALSGAHIRILPSQHWVSSDAGGTNKLSLTVYDYDQSGIDDCPSIVGHAGTYSTGYSTRGNVTTVTSYANAASLTGALITTTHYDITGNAVSSTDPSGNTSYVSYADSFSDSNNTRNTYNFPTQMTSPAPNPDSVLGFPAGAFGSTTPLTTSTVYDFWTGHTTSATDANGRTTTADYTDPLDRLKYVSRADGSATSYFYDRAANAGVMNDYIRMTNSLDAARSTESYQFFDGLGRPVRSFVNEGGSPVVFLTSDTQYDAMGRPYRVSNPYRTNISGDAINPSGRWTQTTFDTLGRPTQVMATADNATVMTSYYGDTATVNDQHDPSMPGHPRRSKTDALGRLVRMDEPNPTTGDLGAVGSPVHATYYAYNALGSLVGVTQGGQPRTFIYDSLSRLKLATNPESGTVTYNYDAGGNLHTRTDARGVTATYTYDHLNRNIITSYLGGGTTTPEARHYFDGATLGRGKPWSSEAVGVSASTIDEYDSMGRPKKYRQMFWTSGGWGQSFNVSRTYDLAGNVLTQTYPSGHTVTYNYDAAGRIGDNGVQPAFTGNLGDGVARTYATGISYSEQGGIRQEQFGTQTPLFHKLRYNARGQLYDIRLSTGSDADSWNRGMLVNHHGNGDFSSWGTSGSNNNGNVLRSHHYIPNDDQVSGYKVYYQDYEYDAMNRLTKVTEMNNVTGIQYVQKYDHDHWGNRTINQGQTTGITNTQFDASDLPNTNRLYAPGDAALPANQRRMQYDASGNLTFDNYTGQGARVYDAENRITTAQDTYQQWSSYAYDADGHRVKRTTANEEWWQVYGIGGELIAEYRANAAPIATTKEYGYRRGELLVTMASGNDRRVKRFVTDLYYGALQRDPTPAELSDKSNQLAQAGAQGQAQLLAKAKEIARSLFTSTNYETSPYRSDTQYVADLYYTYLQRGPDDSGLGWWAAQVPSSGRTNVCNAFEASTEFQTLASTLYGSASSDNQRTEQYVNNLYLGAYGRIATATELQQGRDQLNAAAAQGQSQAQSQAETLGRSLFAAQVSNLSIPAQQFVTNLYEGFLQRAPDSGGLSFWTGQAGSTAASRQNVLNAFAACDPARELSGALYRETFWLVADHIGTPRMVVDRTGSLAGIKRHDDLPFGEEIGANVGGRTTAQGFSVTDNVRQKFTSKERDGETGLDYFLARYYSSAQGRFISPDEFKSGPHEILIVGSEHPTEQALPYADITNPQSLNKYQYCFGNPLRYVDPDGHKVLLSNFKGGDRRKTLGRLLYNLKPAERRFFTTQLVDKGLGGATLELRGKVDKALSQPHTKAFEYLVETVKNEKTVRVEISDVFVDNLGVGMTQKHGGGVTLDASATMSRDVEVYLSISAADITPGEDKDGKPIHTPPSIVAGHEVLGHARKKLKGEPAGEPEAQAVENELREGRGLKKRGQ